MPVDDAALAALGNMRDDLKTHIDTKVGEVSKEVRLLSDDVKDLGSSFEVHLVDSAHKHKEHSRRADEASGDIAKIKRQLTDSGEIQLRRTTDSPQTVEIYGVTVRKSAIVLVIIALIGLMVLGIPASLSTAGGTRLSVNEVAAPQEPADEPNSD